MTDSLLSRLQALTEPSREIDAEIALANGWAFVAAGDGSHWKTPEGYHSLDMPPRYTESLDVVLTLMPKGVRWEVWGSSIGFRGEVWTPDIQAGQSDTNAAIALLIAIMKAKEESKP